MTKLTKEIHIDAKPDRVYDVLCDPACLGQWVTIQDELEQAPDGDLKRGSELVQRLKVAGQRFRVTWKVEQADRPERVVWNGKGPFGTKAKAIYELSLNDEGTKFSYVNEYSLPGGPAGAALGRALRKASGREADKSLKRLKQFIEHG